MIHTELGILKFSGDQMPGFMAILPALKMYIPHIEGILTYLAKSILCSQKN